MEEVSFTERRRLILGIRAVGLFLVGIGLAAPALLIGLVTRTMLTSRHVDTWGSAFGTIDEIAHDLSSKEVLTTWLRASGVWVLSLALGLYLLRRDPVRVLRLVRRIP